MVNSPMVSRPRPKVLALSGGIGGAKLDLGLYSILAPWELGIVANTGDDFRHLGLMICPDLDTILYTLSDHADTDKGWGRAGETWECLDELNRLGNEDTWFGLGDKDLAIHLHRTAQIEAGVSLSQITSDLFEKFNVEAHVWPMCDRPVGTIVQTKDGRDLPFQNYFVREQCVAEVAGFVYDDLDTATAPDGLISQIEDPGLEAIVICPSNPFVSINPILSIPGVRQALRKTTTPIVAVSPLVGGQAVKGPLAKMLAELGLPQTNKSIAEQYSDILDGLILDESDAIDIQDLPVPALATNTVMKSLDDRKTLAAATLRFATQLEKVSG